MYVEGIYREFEPAIERFTIVVYRHGHIENCLHWAGLLNLGKQESDKKWNT